MLTFMRSFSIYRGLRVAPAALGLTFNATYEILPTGLLPPSTSGRLLTIVRPQLQISSALTTDAHPKPPVNSSAASDKSQHCWNCGALQASDHQFFCSVCGSVQPPSLQASYFSLFDISPPTFELDNSSLEAKYKALQGRLHPDRFSLASRREQAYSTDQAALVNRAYDILRRPLARARYLLSLRGLNADEAGAIDDMDLLDFIMKAREEIEAATHPNELNELKTRIEKEQTASMSALAAAFNRGHLEHAMGILTTLQYLERVLRAIQDK